MGFQSSLEHSGRIRMLQHLVSSHQPAVTTQDLGSCGHYNHNRLVTAMVTTSGTVYKVQHTFKMLKCETEH